VTSPEQQQIVKELARDLGISEAGARALLGAVLAEENPPAGKIVRSADLILRETADPHCDARGDVAAVED
jgi:hypothetical protein